MKSQETHTYINRQTHTPYKITKSETVTDEQKTRKKKNI